MIEENKGVELKGNGKLYAMKVMIDLQKNTSGWVREKKRMMGLFSEKNCNDDCKVTSLASDGLWEDKDLCIGKLKDGEGRNKVLIEG